MILTSMNRTIWAQLFHSMDMLLSWTIRRRHGFLVFASKYATDTSYLRGCAEAEVGIKIYEVIKFTQNLEIDDTESCLKQAKVPSWQVREVDIWI